LPAFLLPACITSSHDLSDFQIEQLVGEAGPLLVGVVCDSTENQYLLEGGSIRGDRHAVISNHAQFGCVRNILHTNPCLLVQQKQMDVIQERDVLALAHLVVTASNNDEALVHWQIVHGVSDPAAWGGSLLLNLLPLATHDLAVLHVGSEVAQSVLQFTFSSLASKIVNSIKNGVTHTG